MKATRTAHNTSIEICPVHLSEWTLRSGVSEALAQLNTHSISERTEIAQLLNWNYYGHTPGWYVRSVDLETGQFRQFGQFKPNEALQFPDSEKPQKYLTFPKGAAAEVILLRVDLETWQKVADRYNVPIEPDDIDENRLDLGFWPWVARHPELPVCPTEGIKKAACLLTHGYIPICLTGVWNGKAKGKLKPIPTLVPFLSAGRPVNLVFDADILTKKSVQSALKNLGYLCQKAGCIVGVVTWSLAEDTKGCDDLIVNRGIEAFEMAMNEAQPYGEWLKRLELQFQTPASGMATGSRTKKLPSADIFGAQIASAYRDKWLYCDELKSWLAYEIEKSGVWTPISAKYLAAQIDGILEARGISGYGTNSYIQNIIGKLERVLYTKDWTECSSREFLPFTNGVFEIATGKLHQHGPGFRLTWQLPRPYSVLETDWTLIDSWLTEVTQGNQEHKQLLLCFGAALLRGRSDLQKFLYIKGHGGNGKSVFTNLLTALIGEENSVSLDFPQLEDKHDIAQLFGKRLLIMPDQDKVPKRLSNFKKLTGGDRVNGRRLYENGFQFVFSGLTVITSNPPIFHSNLGTWLLRRLLMAPFDYQCPPEKVRTDLSQELSTQLTAFTNHLLSIPEAEIELVLKGIGKPKLTPTIWDSLCRNDGLTAWVNDWLIYDPDAATAIGSNAKEWSDSDEYSPEHSTLFGSYCLHSRQTNRTPRTKENFSADLLELCGRTLGWEVEKVRTRIGGKQVRAIRGIRLRTDADSSETIEEILSLSFQGHLERDSQSDRISDHPCDNLEPLENQGCDKCDHLFLSNEKKDFEKEITAQSEIFPNLSDQTHSPVTAEPNQGVEAVTEAVATSVTTPVTPQPAKTPVSEIKAEMLACQHSGSVKAFWSKYSGREAQVYRAIAAFTPEEERAWAAAEKRPATRLAKKQVKRVKRAMVACRHQQQTAKVRQDYGDWAVSEVLAHYMSNDEKVTWRAASAQSTFLL